MPDHNTTIETPTEAAALMRMIDFRIPLPWLLTGFVAGVSILVAMYFQLQNVSEKLVSLQIEVKAGNSSYAALASEVALLKFRVEGLEAERRSNSPAVYTPAPRSR